jgi:hypothetical protein
MTSMAAATGTKKDSAREHLERSKALRAESVRAAEGVVRHLREAAEALRQAARSNGR